MESCAIALTPMRSHPGFVSGNKSRRAGICLLPIAWRHAAESPVCRGVAPKPTPIVVVVVVIGGSAIIEFIPVTASVKCLPEIASPTQNAKLHSGRYAYQYKSTYGARS